MAQTPKSQATLKVVLNRTLKVIQKQLTEQITAIQNMWKNIQKQFDKQDRIRPVQMEVEKLEKSRQE